MDYLSNQILIKYLSLIISINKGGLNLFLMFRLIGTKNAVQLNIFSPSLPFVRIFSFQAPLMINRKPKLSIKDLGYLDIRKYEYYQKWYCSSMRVFVFMRKFRIYR
jgi:hypothetical protein